MPLTSRRPADLSALRLATAAGLAAAACVLVATLSAPAAAQIVNVQPLLSDEDGDGFKLEVNGSMTWKTGNVDLFLGKASLLMTYREGIHKLISSSKAEVGLKGGDEFLERVFTHVRYQIFAYEWLTWETYTQAATDRFRRVALRALVGTGPRFELITGPAVVAAVGVSYMFEREVLGSGDQADSGAANNNHRASLFVTGRFTLDPMLSLVHTTYLQPRLDNPIGDVRLASDTSLVVKFNDHLGLSVGFSVTYDSAPPIGVHDVDTATNVGLTFTL